MTKQYYEKSQYIGVFVQWWMIPPDQLQKKWSTNKEHFIDDTMIHVVNDIATSHDTAATL